MIVSLDHFQKQRWSILHHAREDLQQVSFVVEINEDF